MEITLKESVGTRDISIGPSGVFVIANELESYADIINSIISTLKGEIRLDANAGIDYFGTIFTSVSRQNIWEHFVREAVEGLEFVKSISRFTSKYIPRSKTMEYEMTVITDFGEVEVSGMRSA